MRTLSLLDYYLTVFLPRPSAGSEEVKKESQVAALPAREPNVLMFVRIEHDRTANPQRRICFLRRPTLIEIVGEKQGK